MPFLQESSLIGSGSIRESWLGAFVDQVFDRKVGSDVAMQELLEDIERHLSPRQFEIVRLLLDQQNLGDISLQIGVSESTIDKEIVFIKKVLGPKLGVGATSNKQQATSNKQQATSNKQQATSNKQQATSNKAPTHIRKIVSRFPKIHYAFDAILAT